MTIQCHEHVDTRLVLHATKLTATISGDPALTVGGNVHLCRIISVRNVGDCDRTAHMLQQPTDKFPAPASLLHGSCDEGASSHELEDASRSFLQFLLRRGLLSYGITQLLFL